jgi:hypothetical protein
MRAMRLSHPCVALAYLTTDAGDAQQRIVFEPYSCEVFSESFDWIARHEIFEPGSMGTGDYEKSTVSLS